MMNMTSKELKAMAKELKVKNWWNLKKAELIAAIEAAQNEDYTIATENSNGKMTIIAECHHEDITQGAEETADEESIVEEESASENESEASEDVEDEAKTPKEEKKSRGKMIEYNGESKNLNQWAKELGMSGQTLFARIYISGWTIEKAFTTPTKARKKKTEEEA